jgi:hypothetical protein
LNYKIQNQIQFEPCLNLKGFKPFGKILINSLKFYLLMIFMNRNLDLLTCMQNLEVPLQVAIMVHFKYYSKKGFEFELRPM